MNTKHSTNFWIIFALWVFATLFMCLVEVLASYEDKELSYIQYTFIFSGISGILLVLFLSLFLFKNNSVSKRISIALLSLYVTAQILIIGFLIYQDHSGLGNAVVNRILFISFHLAMCFFALRKKAEE